MGVDYAVQCCIPIQIESYALVPAWVSCARKRYILFKEQSKELKGRDAYTSSKDGQAHIA